VLRAHNVEYEIWERFAASERNPLKRAYTRHLARAGKRFEQAALQAVDAVLPITERDAAHIRQLGYTGPLCVLPMGMSLASFPATPPAGQPHRVAFLGSLEWLPNIQGLEWLLEKVWPAVLAAEPAAELHIAGRNPAPGVRQWQYPNVHIHGEIPDAQAYLAEASLVVVPLLAGSGMRVKLLEAFAMARPVVATPLAAEGIAVQSGTHCLLADSPTEFAAGIIHLLRNPEARQNLGQASRQLVQTTYNSQAIVGRLLSFLQSEILPQNQA
jgi:glycosyltransferase involved in cell wall biosynthesis